MHKFKLIFIIVTSPIFLYSQKNDFNKNSALRPTQNINVLQTASDYALIINGLFYLKRTHEETKAYHEWVNTLCKIGEVYMQWGIAEKAVEYYQMAKDTLPLDYQGAPLQLNLLQSLAIAYKKLHQNDHAIINYEAILSIFPTQLSKDQELNILNELLELYNLEDKFFNALGAGNQLLSLFQNKSDSIGATRTYNYMGTIYKKLDNLDAAKIHFVKALKYYPKNSRVTEGKSVILLNLGIIYQSKGDFKQALKCFQEALSIQIANNNEEETARIYTYIAANYLATRAYESCISYAQKAIDISKKYQYLDILQAAYELMWQCHEYQKDLESALMAFKDHVQIKDKIHLQKIKEQAQMDKKLQEAEKLEMRINTLLSENELKVTDLNKEKLERENKEMELYLLKRELELANYQSRQKELLQEKEIDRLVLLEQTITAQAREKQLAFQIQKKQLENKDKQRKLDELKQKNRISQLQLFHNELQIKNQRWLQIVMLMAFVILAIVVYLLFNRYYLKQKAQKQFLHFQNIEIEQRLLRSQMNPHFIFNALNSIQYYITSQDNASAARYLSKFSLLIRSILESSRHQYIFLKDELKLLKLYLELEQLRFSGQFVFDITIDETIDTEEISIPPMIIQPYVENAIIHGVVMLNHQGKITIHYQKTDDFIKCTILDNGIGREAAGKIRKTNNPKHQSIATELTKHRLDLLNKTPNRVYDVTIIDLYDHNQIASGTEVSVSIPYIVH